MNFKVTIMQKNSRRFKARSTQKDIEPGATFSHHCSVMCQCSACSMFERLWEFLFL